MVRLADAEFNALNGRMRRLAQRCVELPIFRWLGLEGRGQDILEVGCGSGYGAWLLSRLEPKSYLGIDLMPEMIDLALKRDDVPLADFRLMDAAAMDSVADASKDVVVIFDALCHIPRWREVLSECSRVLRPGGRLFLEEPSASALRLWEALFQWGHPEEAMFTWQELEGRLAEVGLTVRRRCRLWLFRSYCASKEPPA